VSSSADQFIGFWDYFRTVFVPLNNLELPLKQLHQDTCEALQKAALGELGKSFVVVNIPPRVGKTKIMEALVSWQLAYFPDSQIIYTSYSNELAKTSVRYIQQVMATPWYLDLFATRLGAIRQADHFTTEAGGKVYGDGVGGSLTGLGAGLKRLAGGFIIMDDPSKPDEALSRVESDKLRVWFENTLKSRRNSSQWTPIILCMQRLDTDDLSGFLLREYPDDVHHIKFSALNERGESAIPETVSTQSLLDTQRISPFTFAAQYLQEPTVLGGNLIKIEDFRYYPYGHPPKTEFKVITCDTAWKTKEHSDFSVLQCWGRYQKKAYLIDQMRGKWAPADLLRLSHAFYAKHHKAVAPVAYMAVEEAASGLTLIQDLRKRGVPTKGIVRVKDKVTRVKHILAYHATGMVYIPKDAPWTAAFEQECAAFREDGKSRHDDMVDTMADGVFLCLGKGTSILNVLGGRRPAVAIPRNTPLPEITVELLPLAEQII
jgi:predicted phage terminase large subunit-like protein